MAEQLALLTGPPAPVDLVVVRQLLLQRGPPHLVLIPIHGQLALVRWQQELKVSHPRSPGRLLSGTVGRGRCRSSRHRGHIPIRRQHLREATQVCRVANL
jgi:hypothetical protein